MSKAIGNYGEGRTAVGQIPGTGADIDIALPFTPRYVRLVNRDGLAAAEHFCGMASGTAVKTITAGTMSLVAAPNGVTLHEQFELDDPAPARGFRIGADADLNVTDEEIFWFAAE